MILSTEDANLREHDASAPGSPRDIRVIKRYTNRKLYDTVESRYVTLDEVSDLVKEGTDVRIIDNRSQADLTSVTLAQIILEKEKKAAHMPLGILRDIVRGGGEKLQAFIADELNPRVNALRSEAEHAVARVFKREAKEGDIAAAPSAASEKKPHPMEQAQEFVRISRHTLEEWQRNLDLRLHRAVKTIVGLPSLHGEIQALHDKLAELEKKLSEQARE